MVALDQLSLVPSLVELGLARAILRLLAEGLTNAEKSEALVVSVQTVDHHVSAVLQKLGVTSRRQAAKAAQDLGLTS